MCETGDERGKRRADSHAFVVRVWREDGAHCPTWRGHITHVATGTRRSVMQLEQLSLFICDYLDELRVALPLVWRLRRWLARPWREGQGKP